MNIVGSNPEINQTDLEQQVGNGPDKEKAKQVVFSSKWDQCKQAGCILGSFFQSYWDIIGGVLLIW